MIYQDTQRRQYEGHNTPQGPYVCGEYDGQGVYCGMSAVLEVSLRLTTQLTQLYSFCIHIYCIVIHLLPTKREERGVLGVGSIPVVILPSCEDMKPIALQLQQH